MIYHIRHATTFNYSQPVTFVYNLLHLRPRPLSWQKIIQSTLSVTPEPVTLTERTDFFGNRITYCTVQEKHQSMKVLMECTVEVQPRTRTENPAPSWDTLFRVLQKNKSETAVQAFQYCFDSPGAKRSNGTREYALPSCKAGWGAHQVAMDLMARIHADFKFDSAVTNVSTPVEEVLEKRKGVCQDFAHLMVACLRSVGIPARYMSGYIRTNPPEGKPRLAGADASHAWVGVYCPANSWLDLDPTNNKAADEDFVTIGWGRDYQDVSPVAGVLIGGGKHTVRAGVDVIPESEYMQMQQQQQ